MDRGGAHASPPNPAFLFEPRTCLVGGLVTKEQIPVNGQTTHTASDEELEKVRVREVVGAVFSQEALETMAVELMEAGIDRNDIDLMADWNTVIDKLGLTYPDADQVPDLPDLPRRRLATRDEDATLTGTVFGTLVATGALVAGVPVVASGGALAAVLAASAVGGGIGAALASKIRKVLTADADPDAIEHDISRGGIVVFVRVDNEEQEQRAMEIMRRNGAHNVHVHEIELTKKLQDVPLAQIQPDPWLGEE